MAGKESLRNFIRKTLRESGKSLELAQQITGRNARYTNWQIEEIVLDWLEANNYGNEEICQVMDIHIDKPYFDLYYEIMCEKEKENAEIERIKKQGNKKMKATGEEKKTITKPLKFNASKVILGVSAFALVGAIVCSCVKVN